MSSIEYNNDFPIHHPEISNKKKNNKKKKNNLYSFKCTLHFFV